MLDRPVASRGKEITPSASDRYLLIISEGLEAAAPINADVNRARDAIHQAQSVVYGLDDQVRQSVSTLQSSYAETSLPENPYPPECTRHAVYALEGLALRLSERCVDLQQQVVRQAGIATAEVARRG